MKNNNFYNLKGLNKYYLKLKEKELKKLEDTKIKISREIEEQKILNEKEKAVLDKLSFENVKLKIQYNDLKNTLINRGTVFDIENNHFNIKEWDNLYIKKKGINCYLVTKKDEEIHYVDKKTENLLNSIIKEGYSFSIVVIRISGKSIKIQLRFNKKE